MCGFVLVDIIAAALCFCDIGRAVAGGELRTHAPPAQDAPPAQVPDPPAQVPDPKVAVKDEAQHAASLLDGLSPFEISDDDL
jgi:hypothetical protein